MSGQHFERRDASNEAMDDRTALGAWEDEGGSVGASPDLDAAYCVRPRDRVTRGSIELRRVFASPYPVDLLGRLRRHDPVRTSVEDDDDESAVCRGSD
jgi:hypothetical protein